jgi:hypothetical protein
MQTTPYFVCAQRPPTSGGVECEIDPNTILIHTSHECDLAAFCRNGCHVKAKTMYGNHMLTLSNEYVRVILDSYMTDLEVND